MCTICTDKSCSYSIQFVSEEDNAMVKNVLGCALILVALFFFFLLFILCGDGMFPLAGDDVSRISAQTFLVSFIVLAILLLACSFISTNNRKHLNSFEEAMMGTYLDLLRVEIDRFMSLVRQELSLSKASADAIDTYSRQKNIIQNALATDPLLNKGESRDVVKSVISFYYEAFFDKACPGYYDALESLLCFDPYKFSKSSLGIGASFMSLHERFIRMKNILVDYRTKAQNDISSRKRDTNEEGVEQKDGNLDGVRSGLPSE